MRRWCIFEYRPQFSCLHFLTRACSCYFYFFSFLSISGTFSLPLTFFSYLTALKFLSRRASLFSLFLFPFAPRWFFFPAEPEEKQKEILNNTIPEGKDSGDLPVFTPLCGLLFCRVIVGVLFMWIWEYKCGVHAELSLVFSEVCGRLPRPVVGGDGASRQRGAAQRGRVSVRLQGGPGLRRPGDSGLWHEGNASEDCRLLKESLLSQIHTFNNYFPVCWHLQSVT